MDVLVFHSVFLHFCPVPCFGVLAKPGLAHRVPSSPAIRGKLTLTLHWQQKLKIEVGRKKKYLNIFLGCKFWMQECVSMKMLGIVILRGSILADEQSFIFLTMKISNSIFFWGEGEWGQKIKRERNQEAWLLFDPAST